ncbi:MAG: hypothetical protein BGO67_05195 [Alphaproteobacteria bacterium 41-28]|nr:MAG: hypothetical protein BGO67_05195 [Alphaproteobacteria bacterium 41-28]
MKSDFFKVALVVSLALGPAKAMKEDEEPSKHTQCKLLQKKSSKTKSPLSSEVPIESLPDELLLTIFTFVEIPDLGKLSQVSTRWNKITEIPSLWKFMGAKYYGDFLSPNDLAQNPKQMVISHSLRVVVNHTESLTEIDRLVSSYQLHLYNPLFKKYITEMDSYLWYPRDFFQIREELIMQGNGYFIERKIEGLNEGHDGYKQDLEVAREFNEFLIHRGDQKAIERKIKGLTCGGEEEPVISPSYIKQFPHLSGFARIKTSYGYKKDLSALKKFRELLITKEELLIKEGDQKAIERKLVGLEYGRYGYEKDLEAARKFNESLVGKGDQEAIWRKIEGLAGTRVCSWGYQKDSEAARELNESLVEKGDQEAIERKISGLYSGDNGYEKDPAAARELNESLVEKGVPKAIERKLRGFASGYYGYEKDLKAARKFNESLVEKGDIKAIERKIFGLYLGNNGYENDPAAARELNESLAEKGDQEAIKRKIEGLSFDGKFEKYGYKRNLEAARRFNESLVEKGDLEAIKRKMEGLIEGRNGYIMNPSTAKEFIENLVMDKNPVARGIGKYVKALAMKYGIPILGYKDREKDREKVVEFIKENHVPY